MIWIIYFEIPESIDAKENKKYLKEEDKTWVTAMKELNMIY